MGLIKALTGAVGGTLADQWKEFFYCDALDKETLVVKGQKRTTSRTSNTKGNDNIISNGSGIAVADGQCMIIVEQGKVVEVCAEPGEFTYDTSSEPSIFSGSLGKSIIDTFKTIGRRISYGGDTGKDQRIYYFNLKEIMDNKFGTASPVPFRVVDANLNLDIDMSLRCYGVYSYKITNPLLFYSNVCGNVTKSYTRDEIDNTLKTEFISALQPAFAKLSELGLRPNQIPAHNTELETAMKETLSEKWSEWRGIEVLNVAVGSITLPKEDQDILKKLQQAAVLKDPTMAGATLVTAQAQAMQDAAKNEGGAMNGFIGMGMAMNAGGGAGVVQGMYSQGQQQNQMPADSWKCSCGNIATGNFCSVCGEGKPQARKENEWICPKCGKTATGNFCPECGEKKPADADGWTCPKCNTLNKGKFCSQCGEKKPAGAKLYKCDKCGWEPADPAHPPKYCPECGDPFGDEDVVK